MGLSVGDKAPDFEIIDEDGRTVSSSEIFGHGPVVIYFYPADDTPVCTAESCAFRDDYQDFLDAGARIYGVSADSAESHKKFKERYKLPFSLLSDSGDKLRKLFGVPKNFFIMPGRVTYVFDKDRTLRHTINASLFARKHVVEALATLRACQATH